MDKWYYAVDEQQNGPVDPLELASRLEQGILPPDTLVWKAGMSDWLPANQIPELFPEGAPPTPAPPPTPQAATASAPAAAAGKVAFLYIPVARLVVLSILSCGLYEIYWIYKNWKYLKLRDGLDIWPFWRGWFGIFFCHSLLNTIHEDEELTRVEEPDFYPNALATGWILLLIVANVLSRAPGMMASIISLVIPSFLCLVPVQRHINNVNAKNDPEAGYSSWSAGHIVCILFGLFIWGMMFLGLAAEVLMEQGY